MTSPTAPPLTKLQLALAKVREQHSTVTTSDDVTPTSLETFVRMYNKAGKACFIDYMEGAKRLYAYLSPIEIPQGIVFTKDLPVAGLISAYSAQRLTQILCGKSGFANPQFNYIHNLVLAYTAKHMLEGIEL